ncbi:MAG: hypothetical protein CSA42_02135 [Gammaproteobacteria bacterium]|nr:MAG: hypothetical protein CSA42_02135 [Gammaproteobacteria bacterium]
MKEKNIDKIIILITISIAFLGISCQTTKPITKEYLVGKKFEQDVFIGIMGVNYLTFIDNEKIHYVIHDKRDYGYNGTYTLENKDKKQYIKISNIEKFGFQFDALEGYDKDYVMIEVKSPTKLKVLHSGMIFKLSEKKK